jgi:bifunctional non-homologous end joining protein LigD
VDGYRTVAYNAAGGLRRVSRQGRDHTNRFQALAALRPAELVLDGEVAVYDEQFVWRFEWLRERPKDEVSTPPLFIAFDCLVMSGKDLRGLPLRKRRDILERLIDGQEFLLPVRPLATDGLEAWDQVVKHGYEGLIAKDAASPYVGGRTLKWLKVKQPRYREGERGWGPKGKS